MTIDELDQATGPGHRRLPGAPAEAQSEINPKRWIAFIFLGLAQLMLILDISIVNIALPSVQADLGFSAGDRQWIITGYTLAFGSLLLLGGRIADYTGRRRTFLIGLAGFATASALGGIAGNFEILLTGRVLQGAFAALLSPAILSLISINFTDPGERAKAFGAFGGIAAAGGAIGLLAGGALTDYLDWRWCMYVNVPIALIAACGWFLLRDNRGARGRTRFDIPGVLLSGAGLVAIVYGSSQAETKGWGSAEVVTLLITGVLLLAAFALVETRVANPLLPLRILLSRTRSSAYLAMGVIFVGALALFLFLTFYLQLVLGYSPMRAGVAFLPMAASVAVGAGGVATRLLPKVPPRALIVPGMVIVAGALAWLARLDVDSSYAGGVLPGLCMLGFGMGISLPATLNYATYGADEHDTGIASACLTTLQQVGGSLGLAVLSTIATSTTDDFMKSAAGDPSAAAGPKLLATGLTEGFTKGFAWGAVVLAVGAVLIGVLMNTRRPSTGEVSVGLDH
ncbi:MFS transporter [Actinoplanes sp. NPDC051513]|uniref:MFS transporter n=1 Tax=Actinoplanes sp. NPDC051513 TaxID=3363908 RepID=UPI00379F5703